MSDGKLITIAEASETIKVSISTLNRAARLGKLQGKRFGNVWVFEPSEVSRWLREDYKPKMKRK